MIKNKEFTTGEKITIAIALAVVGFLVLTYVLPALGQ